MLGENEKAWDLSHPENLPKDGFFPRSMNVLMDCPEQKKLLIPNFNTLSTIIDRLIVENVKLSHFEYLLDRAAENSLNKDLAKSVDAQLAIIPALREELTKSMAEIFQAGHYETIEEKRTFV